MKTLILAALLATATLAQAQQLPTKTVKFYNNKTGELVGTATYFGNTAYLRDAKGEHYATMVRNPDGTAMTYDPSGNIIGPVKLPDEP